jgi:4-hydroxybutyryl-CoA dehydratase/vinylacetyl-CoA-Delta-isomerase
VRGQGGIFAPRAVGIESHRRQRLPMKQEIWRNHPVGSKVDLVERLLERGLSDDPARPITRKRPAGKCCDLGCSAPGQPVMVDLSKPARRA